MKAKTIEELIKHRIEVYNEAMKKEEVKTDMASQMYLRGALEELKFIEQNIIQLEPRKRLMQYLHNAELSPNNEE